ncbi:MAG: hypothetical protein ACOC7U_08675 [Spirochaetota bacterium]
MKIRVLVIVIVIFLLFGCFQGVMGDRASRVIMDMEDRTPAPPREKDPFIAGLLSWLMMGVGQIYCKEYTKGSIFIAADLADKAALILLISHINSKYSSTDKEILPLNWAQFDTQTKILTAGYFAATLGIRFYNVIDAIKSANRYNQRYFSENKSGKLSVSVEQDAINLGYSLQYSE